MKQVLTKDDISAAIGRLADTVVKEITEDQTRWALVGIHSRGVPLAKRLAAAVKERGGPALSVGSLDITFYRDDVGEAHLNPVVQDTDIPFDVTGLSILLVDDVLYTGRTIRCALDELMDFGRPEKVRLAVLVDRGRRELPIHPDFVGETVTAPADARVEVRLMEEDEKDGVWIVDKRESGRKES